MKLTTENSHIVFECRHCNDLETITVPVQFIVECGTPVCATCDGDMDLYTNAILHVEPPPNKG